jgi:hypothetical protein
LHSGLRALKMFSAAVESLAAGKGIGFREMHRAQGATHHFLWTRRR